MAPAAGALRLKSQPEIALVLIERALQTNPYYADLMLARIDRQLQLGLFAEAAAGFDRLRALVPRSAFITKLCGSNTDCRLIVRAPQ
jgi:hypothetical protein